MWSCVVALEINEVGSSSSAPPSFVAEDHWISILGVYIYISNAVKLDPSEGRYLIQQVQNSNSANTQWDCK